MNLRHNNRKPKKTKVVSEQKAAVGRSIKEKFAEKNDEYINRNPLVPMNQQQAEYIYKIKSNPYVAACGFAGSSKTYIPTRIAVEKYLRGEIDKIIIVRPAVSDSKSLGFFGGDLLTKAKNWILPVLDVLEEFLGKNRVELMLTRGDILPVPLETIKGRSFKNSFIIVDEAEDLSKKELIKCITRLGENSTMVFAGDIRQVDVRGGSGLEFAVKLASDDTMKDFWGIVDFDDPSEIVRSVPVKHTILRLTEMGEM